MQFNIHAYSVYERTLPCLNIIDRDLCEREEIFFLSFTHISINNIHYIYYIYIYYVYLLYFIRETDVRFEHVLFISDKSVKYFLAITFLLLVISS